MGRVRSAGVIAAVLALATGATAQTIADERRALDRARVARTVSIDRAVRLERAAASASDEATRARAALAAVAAGIQSAEAGIDAAEAQIAVVERLRTQQRARLAAQQGPTVRLAAALQTLARRPPALALVRPGSVTDLVHVHAVLAGVAPVIRARTTGLRTEVERGRQLRLAADAALADRRGAQATLAEQRRRLAVLEAGKRQVARTLSRSAMVEQDRAIAMGEEARDIVGLMTRIDDAASVRARLETLPGPLLRPAPGVVPVANAAPAPVRRVPAYRLPVVGQIVTGLGEVSQTGVRARGLTLATRGGAQVVAPTSGRVAFAGAFRGYGNIVVIDHGLGWTTLLTNLAALDVKVGDEVDQGTPLGRAGLDRPRITVELRRRGQPVDIAKLAT